jgi:Zn finger protein HypA/HybF involved in hydrogenase expression
MTLRFKGKPNFDLSQPCPLCAYKIQPNHLVRLASHVIKCPKCGGAFDQMGNGKPMSTSRAASMRRGDSARLRAVD